MTRRLREKDELLRSKDDLIQDKDRFINQLQAQLSEAQKAVRHEPCSLCYHSVRLLMNGFSQPDAMQTRAAGDSATQETMTLREEIRAAERLASEAEASAEGLRQTLRKTEEEVGLALWSRAFKGLYIFYSFSWKLSAKEGTRSKKSLRRRWLNYRRSYVLLSAKRKRWEELFSPLLVCLSSSPLQSKVPHTGEAVVKEMEAELQRTREELEKARRQIRLLERASRETEARKVGTREGRSEVSGFLLSKIHYAFQLHPLMCHRLRRRRRRRREQVCGSWRHSKLSSLRQETRIQAKSCLRRRSSWLRRSCNCKRGRDSS